MIVYSPQDEISTHFKHYEIIKSSSAARYGIDNTPSSEVLTCAEGLAINVLEPIRNHFNIPFSPQSWYRGEKLEKHICWSSFKKWCIRKQMDFQQQSTWDLYFSRKSHPKGEAADIEISGIPNDTLYDWIKDNLEYDQLIREFPKAGDPYSGWVHVSWTSVVNRHQNFTIG